MVLRLSTARDPEPAAMVPPPPSERPFGLPRPHLESIVAGRPTFARGQSSPAKWPITSPANPDASPITAIRSPLRHIDPEVTRAS